VIIMLLLTLRSSAIVLLCNESSCRCGTIALCFRCCGKYPVFVQPQKNLESISEQLRIPGSKSLGPIGQVS